MADNENSGAQNQGKQGGNPASLLIPIIIIMVLVGFYVMSQKEEKKPAAGGNGEQGAAATAQQQGGGSMELVGSSGAAMTAALGDAIERKEWIVVTGWTPHWMFNRWDVKYLDDPKNVYGGAEEIRTLVRKGLKEDMPEVYKFLDAFQWKPADMQQVMLWNEEEGADPAETAKRWVKENADTVEGWLKGIENRDLGKTVKMANVAWSSEKASANVIKAVLEQKLGCTCEITNTTAALMYESVATGDQDFMAGAWLPTTQKAYYAKVKDQIDDLGANLVGTKIGLVVPAYVTIDSIAQLGENADKFDGEIIGIDPGAGIMGTTKEAIKKYNLE